MKDGVTIIITTFNRVDLLRRCLMGAMSQVYEHLEIIVSDNVSTDKTEELVKEFQAKDKRIIYFKNSTNLGSKGNHVIAFTEYCKTDWAVFVSDDDYLTDPEFISRGMKEISLQGAKEVAFYQSAVVTHFESSGEDVVFTPNIESKHTYELGEYFLEYFNINFFSFTTTLFNRKYLVEEVLTKTFFGSDVQLMLAMSLGKRVILDKQVSGVYNIHLGQNFGKSSFKNYLKLYKETYIEVCNYAYTHSSIKKELIDEWKQQSIDYYKLNIEGWVKNKIMDNHSSLLNIKGNFVKKLYPRIKKYLDLSFVVFPAYERGNLEKINIYLPGLYYQVYWSVFSARLK